MDKETLIKLAQPAATFAFAMSIFSLPFIAKASGVMSIQGAYSNQRNGGDLIHVKLVK